MLLIIVRHRANIVRLLRGTEPQFTFRAQRALPQTVSQDKKPKRSPSSAREVVAPRWPCGLGRSREPHRLSLWVHGADVLARCVSPAKIPSTFPACPYPDDAEVAGDLGEALAGAEIVSAWRLPPTPASTYRAMLPHLDAKTSRNTIFVSATKGLEHDSLARMSEVIAETIAENFVPRLAVLSGPASPWKSLAAIPPPW